MKRPADEIDGTVVVAASAATTTTAKPVFLTKAQREQLALKRLQEEVTDKKHLLIQNRPSAISPTKPSYLASAPPPDGRHQRSFRDRERDRDRDRERERDRDSELRRSREKEREEETKARERARMEKLAEREREKELDAIKEQYLGSKKPKKRVIKPSEKFRFSFDWENTEDTSRDMNVLYQNAHEARLLFGRGFRAGMDRREQKKLAAKNEKDLREEIRKKKGVEERPEEVAAQKLKEEPSNLYDNNFGMRVHSMVLNRGRGSRNVTVASVT